MPSAPRALVVIAVAASCALLAACAPDDHALTPTGSAPAPATATPTGEGTFDPDSDPVSESVGINCQQLLNDQAVYDWGSGNFALDVDYVPAAGSAAAQAVAIDGLACSWVNLTSGETVDIAVSAPGSAALETAAATAAGAGEPAPLIAPEAYFADGHVDAFVDKYWITADSAWFVSQEDAAALVTVAIDALG